MTSTGKKRRWPIDPYFAAGLAAVVVVGGVVMLRNPQSARARVIAENVQPIVARLDSLGLGHRYGPADAPVKIVELFDFECPACAASHRLNWPVIQRYAAAGVASYTVYDFPLPSHRGAVPAALLSACVERADPGRAWELRDRLFARQAEWVSAYPVESALLAIAAGVRVDTAAARRCVAESAAAGAPRLKAAWDAGSSRGLTFIPVWTVNGRPVDWPQLEQAILAAQKETR